MQKVYIITGLSGSGKTTAVQAFEDASFYCVDNMPIELLPKFLDLPLKENPDISGLAFVMDMRSKNFISDYAPEMDVIRDLGFTPKIIFLEADIDTLQKRYSQTRRQHPVSKEKNLLESIKQEALNAISKLPDDANIDDIMYRLYVIDKVARSQQAVKDGKTISVGDLKKEVQTW